MAGHDFAYAVQFGLAEICHGRTPFNECWPASLLGAASHIHILPAKEKIM
jgi:hypothetical protein